MTSDILQGTKALQHHRRIASQAPNSTIRNIISCFLYDKLDRIGFLAFQHLKYFVGELGWVMVERNLNVWRFDSEICEIESSY